MEYLLLLPFLLATIVAVGLAIKYPPTNWYLLLIISLVCAAGAWTSIALVYFILL